MLTAMGVAEEDLDNELRNHKQQQEAAAATEADGRLNGVETLAGVDPREEGVGQDGQRDDVDMEVEGATAVEMERDIPGNRSGFQRLAVQTQCLPSVHDIKRVSSVRTVVTQYR